MQSFARWRILIVILVCLGGALFALPNILSNQTLSKLPSWFPDARVNLGLDLQGGSHILLSVDLDAVVQERLQGLMDTTRRTLRENKIRYRGLRSNQKDQVTFALVEPADRDRALVALSNMHQEISVEIDDTGHAKEIFSEAMLQDLKRSALSQSREIVERRIDEMGTREPTIQIQGEDRIVVQLPGVSDPSEVKDLLGQTARLSFHEVQGPIQVTEGQMPHLPEGWIAVEYAEIGEESKDAAPPMKGYVVPRGAHLEGHNSTDFEVVRPTGSETLAIRLAPAFQEKFQDLVQKNRIDHLVFLLDGAVLTGDMAEEKGGSVLFTLPQDQAMKAEQRLQAGGTLEIHPVARVVRVKDRKVPTVKDSEALVYKSFGAAEDTLAPRSYVALVVKEAPVIRGDMLVDSRQIFDENNKPGVSLSLDSLGGERYWEFTKKNVGHQVAIIVDDKVISAPVIQSPLRTESRITGNFSVQKSQELSMLLRSGALPAPISVIEERTVGPDLGADSIAAGKMATVWSVIAVALFMIIAYKFFGLIADIALVFNLILLIAALSLLGATLTLPGIAGIALTLGMAVDANVLIFERIKEELRLGRGMWPAIDAGFSRAMATIIDSNVTTLIGAVILYQFGTGPVRGFAVSLGIGIIISMFTAVTLTRLMVAGWVKWRRPTQLSI